MLIKPRKVRRSSKFSSRIATGSRQRREYAATVYSTAIIQAILACTMILAAIRSYQAVSAHGSDLALPLKLAFPLVFTIAALLVARSSLRNIQSARSMHSRRPPRDPDEE